MRIHCSNNNDHLTSGCIVHVIFDVFFEHQTLCKGIAALSDCWLLFLMAIISLLTWTLWTQNTI